MLDAHHEKSKIEPFINGLIPALKSCLIIKKPTQLAEAISLAREYDQQLTTVKGKLPSLSVNLVDTDETQASLAKVETQLEALTDRLDKLQLTNLPPQDATHN